MQDSEFKQLLLANLAKIEAKQDNVAAQVAEIKTLQALQGRDIESIMRDIPEIKEDLRQHKEGNIQNRTRIEHIERLNMDQDALINKTLETYQKEVAPVVEHVIWMQSLPAKITKVVITTAKIMGALVAILGSGGALTAYLAGWFK